MRGKTGLELQIEAKYLSVGETSQSMLTWRVSAL